MDDQVNIHKMIRDVKILVCSMGLYKAFVGLSSSKNVTKTVKRRYVNKLVSNVVDIQVVKPMKSTDSMCHIYSEIICLHYFNE